MKFIDVETELSGSKWARVDVSDAKAHACPAELAPPLLKELLFHFGPPKQMDACHVSPIQLWTLDFGGMVSANRSWQEMRLDGLIVRIPSQLFAVFLERLETLPLRHFSDRIVGADVTRGQEYYKFHSHYNCLVLTPIQRQDLFEQMRDVAPAAAALGDAEDASLQRARAELHEQGVLFCPDLVKKRTKGDA